ncbi:FAD binding domain-containing protein [Sodiomyces alkalinus F11]|uniref:FAD binding domain-containing protein n=1 Tax=Sodiomyces alkalinus (strain CBS 110278 / VKM F-3762 / F11) TaxID=1314773 RepID=A0A3N2Q8J3_SODAK|nr:FAD binding domain-containing protein [Sodiomyces alkalinus F11]ROT43007.1 FAD binding domain-containing protein [Sodiomyces alkalinus F11]
MFGKQLGLAVVSLLALHQNLALAQTIVVDGETLPADEVTIAPAEEAVEIPESTTLFPEEVAQLTDSVLANLTELELSNISLFSFDDEEDDENSILEKRTLFGPCKTYPGDLLYPGKLSWDVFKLLLGGRLIKTVPFASVCYDDFGNFDQARCNFISANWINNSYIHIEDPTSINAVLFEGGNCLPQALDPTATNCRVGGLPSYVVDARNVAQVQLAVNFARNLNLRLVVKNTGHDFGAKSTGAGSLSIWTHNFRKVQFFQNHRADGGYRGPAFKVGAGVPAFELYEAAHRHGVTVVGGEGATVGVMGGYILGGGHSPLSGLYGMASDSVLSFEVVLANGRFVTASATKNPDLFWALRGGGGSTYGVVTSVTVKAYPKIHVSTLTFELMTTPTVTADQFWAAIRAFFEGFVEYAVDNANYEYFRLTAMGPGAFYFDMGPWFAPGMTSDELRVLVAPLFARFDAIGVDYSPVFRDFDNYRDAWAASFPLEPWGSNFIRQASRLFPRANWEDEAKLNATFDAIKSTVEEGNYVIAFNIHAAPAAGYPDTAVNSAWRDTVMHCIAAAMWDPAAPEPVIKAASDTLTFDWMQRWRDVSPGAGAYMSESDYIEPDFTQAFWGTKYPRALQLKKKYDPRDVFYAQNAVGSEFWEMSENILGNLPSQNSRLCRKN